MRAGFEGSDRVTRERAGAWYNVGMEAMRLDGSERDLEEFSLRVLQSAAPIETPSPFERRMRWDVRGNTGLISASTLRSGISLAAVRCRWERAAGMVVDHAPMRLEFVLSRGPRMRMTSSAGDSYLLGGGTFQIGQVKEPLRLVCAWDASTLGQDQDNICLTIDGRRLRELLGSQVLPAPLERIVAHPGAYPRAAQAMSPALHRLLDEILGCSARGTSRQLYLEAKGLELMAAMVDQLEESEGAASPLLTQHDVARLERARHILLACMVDPPTLPELARRAGLNEVKLKAGFRALFGTSVFAYLRNHRLDEAHRLLRQRACNVTEVAQRVGYENPSKFAAAFRKRFGVSPSTVG
ncbi:helix-turn-helix transcriptional regulator [Sorangium sp. So ce131]|uniref:helix-turn-helix transcriptional regulator n=1 Tax=Sorangium sp. So ce131 TaxID=3133282 RepID=UPI003F62DF62